MRVMLIVKGESLTRALEYTKITLNRDDLGSGQPVRQFRMGAIRIEVDLEDTQAVYEWFNRGGYIAPYPDGTLLFFTVSP